MEIKKILKKLSEDIENTHLDENLFFIQTYNSYLKNIKLLKEAYDEKEYDKCAKLSNANSKIALRLFTMLEDEKMVLELKDESNKKCPDFEHMPPKKLREWCKKYDIDMSDFAKDYLYKALRRKWERENGN